ncbi:tetratricopeptide repeat protein [Kaarinaea lacus]
MDTPMTYYKKSSRASCAVVLTLGLMAYIYSSGVSALPNPQERIDYWQQNYSELTEVDDPRVANVHHVFGRVLQAAGNRYGVIPRLFIIKENPFNIVLPISIPDGWIILSRQVLDMCYEDEAQGDDRLAFVLAHEIAHLLDDDFWHMNFFSALSLLKKDNNVEQKVVNEIQGIFTQTAKIEAKELRADERGILFSAMAGYNPFAIVNEQAGEQGSFFHEWHELLNVSQYEQLGAPNTHPTSSQRSTAVLARLKQVSEQSDLFSLGLILYQTGKFELAAKAFGEFLRYFPSREVYHNLATTHHQIALNYYQADLKLIEQRLLPFQLPIMADPYTRAAFGVTRDKQQNQEKFANHITLAIQYYQSAIEQDANYLLAYQNLASAYLLNSEPYKAVAILQDIVARTPDNAILLNILGVGFYMTDNPQKAEALLTRAIAINEQFAAAYYNLGKIAYLQGNEKRAQELWTQFVKVAPDHRWSTHLASNFNIQPLSRPTPSTTKPVSRQLESLVGVQVGLYLDELPTSLGTPRIKKFAIADSRISLLEYPDGISIVAEGDEVRIVVASEKFHTENQQGINIGSTRHSVISNYGLPALRLNSTRGQNLLYPRDGVSFQLADDKVTSWAVY